MSYKICYTPEDTKRYPQTKPKRVPWLKILMIVFVITAVVWLKEQGIPDILIPGDPDITRNAVRTMVSEVQDGESLEDAVFVFCKEILDNRGA